QAIGTDQQGATGRTAPHPFDQPADQGQITLLADLTAQPQTRLDHHGERHPHDVALADMTSGRTVLVGAEYGRGVHDAPPGCAWKTLPREVCLDPRLLDNFTAPRFGVELSGNSQGRKFYSSLLRWGRREQTPACPRPCTRLYLG